MNPGFDLGLLGWRMVGTVFGTGEQAVLVDSGEGSRSYLWQAMEAPDGPAVFSFDFLLSLSGVGLPGSVPDVTFASLYFFNDPVAFEPSDLGSFSDVIPVADFDSGGADNPTAVAPGVVIGPSPKGPEYRRLELQFAHPGGYLAPVFEINSLNGVAGDSTAAIDNVSITVVPEPSFPALVVLTGSVFAGCFRRRVPLQPI